MKKYASLFRIRFINSLQYRGALIGHILKNYVFGIMEILVYAAIYRTDALRLPMKFSQLVSYVWMRQIIIILFTVVFSDEEIYTAISSGAVVYDLVRPIGLYGKWFSQSAANRVAFTAVNCLPLVFLAALMPKPYRLTLQIPVWQLALFLLSALLSFLVVVAFAMLMYISLFYIISQRGVRIIVTAVVSFLSGGEIPLVFFPEKILAVVKLLPFAAMQNMPLQIFAGTINGMEAVWGIVFQLFWLAALYLLGRICMGCALKRVVVQGG